MTQMYSQNSRMYRTYAQSLALVSRGSHFSYCETTSRAREQPLPTLPPCPPTTPLWPRWGSSQVPDMRSPRHRQPPSSSSPSASSLESNQGTLVQTTGHQTAFQNIKVRRTARGQGAGGWGEHRRAVSVNQHLGGSCWRLTNSRSFSAAQQVLGQHGICEPCPHPHPRKGAG